MTNKEVILITAHTPDSVRQKLLINLINSINREKYDVVVSANSKLSEEVFELCNYIVYNKENHLLTKFYHKFSLAWRNDLFYISTSEVKKFNHIIAAGKLIFDGIKFCKAIGYNKLHFLEYDSIIVDHKILEENSVKLDNYPIIWYNHPTGLGVYSSYSLNISVLTDDWINYFDNNVERYINSNNSKVLEEFSKEFFDLDIAYQENLDKYNECIKTNLFNTDNNDDWAIVLSDGESIYSFVIGFNKYEKDIDTFFIVNNQSTLNVKMSNNVWRLNRIGSINEIDSIKIIIDKTLEKEYDFTQIDKNHFFAVNYIKHLK